MNARRLIYLFLSWVLTNVALSVSGAPPAIDFPPKDQSVVLYQHAAFGVIASGTALLFYQWRKDGVPIAGATNDQIVLAHAQFSDTGKYSVVVSNTETNVTSGEATLTVNLPRAGELDCSFVCGDSIESVGGPVAMQPDGKVLIGGSFPSVNGAARGGVARLNPDGTTDHTFMNGLSGTDGNVYSIALQRDGKVII